MEGDFHWHKHDDIDEIFLVLERQLDIELQDRMVVLIPGQRSQRPKASCTSRMPGPVARADGQQACVEPTRS
jgi:ethanolamine utilization protein EutQ (cupin superfamily)